MGYNNQNNTNQKSYQKQEGNRYSPYPKFSNFKKSGKPKTKHLDLKELTSISKIKNKLRDTARLLKKPNLASNVRTEIERKVTNLESLLKERENVENLKKFNEKNKGIMHIEKKKCLRSLKQLTKKLEEFDQEEGNEQELEKLEHNLFETKLNLNYIKYYPITEEKYYPLFGTNQKGKALESRESIKDQIKVRMLSGEFDNDEDEEDVEDGQSNSKTQKKINQLQKVESVEGKPKKNAILNDDFFAIGGDNNNNNNQIEEFTNNEKSNNNNNNNNNDDDNNDNDSSSSDDSEPESDENSSDSSESESE